MNYIVLEGIGLYIVLIMILLLLVITVGCIICLILSDNRRLILEDLLLDENEKVRDLSKQNFLLKLKCGEFDIDEK